MPPNFILFRWRQEMKASYQDMLDTPYEVILDDMEYLRLTTTMQNIKAQKAAPK